MHVLHEPTIALADVVAGYLARAGFAVDVVHDGLAAVDVARAHTPDLLVLDLMLPGLHGIEVCRRLRTFSDAYVIVLTARDGEEDKVEALSTGADDYLVKPFSPRELIARVEAMLRRPRTAAPGAPPHGGEAVLRAGDLVIDTQRRTVTLGGDAVDLTRTEFDLLVALAGAPDAVHSRAALLERVWGRPWFGDEHVIDVHVAHLRRKLGDDPARGTFVRTVRGVGYAWGPA
jgi:DNA-binding response OmpR family regulator